MALKAIFPPGLVETTVNGLHQWDYGQQLEIQSEDLPGLVEVHFACTGMTEAVVRFCETFQSDASTPTAVAAIPDGCLEQTSPITAWVYFLGESSGTTCKTITMPIIPRTRPQPRESVPEEFSDVYTEAVEEINHLVEKIEETVDDLEAGNLPIGSVAYAEKAGEASTAATAGHASTAGAAESATKDANGNTITAHYLPKGKSAFWRDIQCGGADWTDLLTPYVKIGELGTSLRTLRSVSLVVRTSEASGRGYLYFPNGFVTGYHEGLDGVEYVNVMCTGGGTAKYSNADVAAKMVSWVDFQLKLDRRSNILTVHVNDSLVYTPSSSAQNATAFPGSTLSQISLFFAPEVV